MKNKTKIHSFLLIIIIFISFQSTVYDVREKEEEIEEIIESTPQSSLTTTLRPNSNVQTNTFQAYSYLQIDESSPDGLSCYTHLGSTGEGELLEVGFTNTPANTIEITEIHFYVYAREAATGVVINMAPRIGTLFAEDYNPLGEGSYSYVSEDWFGTWTKAQIDAMSFRMRASNHGSSDDRAEIDQVYCTITYTTLVPPATPSTPSASETTCYDGTSRLSFSYPATATRMYIYEATSPTGTYVYQTYKTPSTTYHDISKTSEQTRYYKLRAWNDAGYSGYSGYRTITWVKPPTPTLSDPTTQTIYNHDAFDVIRGSVGSYVNAYDLEVSIDEAGYADWSSSSSATQSYDPPATDHTYRFRLAVRNTVFTVWSSFGYSETIHISAPETPDTPTSDSPQYETPITITWDDTITGANVVNLQYSTNAVDFYDISGATSSPTSYGVSEGAYYFRVRATNTVGTTYGSYNTVNINTPSDPGAPTCSSPDFDGDLEINWNAGTGSTSANLQISTNGVDFTDIPGETSSPSYLTDIEDGSYWFRVRSTNVFGTTYSSISSEIIVNSLAPQITGISNSTKEYGTDIVLVWYIHDESISDPYYTLNRTVDSIETTLVNSTWINQNFTLPGRNTFYFSDYFFQYSILVYNFTLYVFDGLGLSTNITFYINVSNTVNPEISFINNTHIIETDESFTLEWQIEDPSYNISTYDLDYKKNNDEIQNLRDDILWENGDLFSFQILDFGFVNQSYNVTFYVIANDNLGLLTNESFILYVNDNIPIIVCNVSDSSIEYSNTTDFEITIYDVSINITSIIVSYIFEEVYSGLLNTSWISGQKFTISNLDLVLGNYVFTINVSDGNGFISEEFIFIITNLISPTITLTDYDPIINRNKITDYITTFQWTISDYSQLSGTYNFYYEINGNTTYIFKDVVFSNYTFDLILNNLTKENQIISFTLKASDGLGLSSITRFDITIESDESIIERIKNTNLIISISVIVVFLISLVFIIMQLYLKNKKGN